MAQALAGIRVLDYTRVVAGPYCTYQLALMGAEVIKVEAPGRGDPVRHSAAGTDAYYYERGMATNFLPQNANKRSITLQLAHDAGRAIALELSRRADVIVENFRSGAIDTLGLGYETVKALNPNVVWCSLTGYGQTGPKATHTAYDGVIQAAGGMMSVIGTRETGPLKVGPPITDYASGMAGAFAIAAALFQRAREGCGQYIDVSMLDTSLALMSSYVTDYFATGNNPGAARQRASEPQPSAGTYDTREGRITLGANEDHQFRRLCGALGLGHLLADPRFAEVPARRRHRDALHVAFRQVLATRTAEEWENVLSAAGVPAARIRTVAEILEHPQVRTRGVLHRFEKVPGLDRDVTVMHPPFRLAHDGTTQRTPPPRIGEHTEAVLGELGYDAAAIERLRVAGTI